MNLGSEAQSIVKEFEYSANALYGTYLDATMAVGDLAKSYTNYHTSLLEQLKASGHPIPAEALDPVVIYAVGSEGAQRPVHQTTVSALVNRNALGGRHFQLLARMCVVTLYHYWEGEYRPRLRVTLNQQVEHKTFGELGALRRSIIHRGGRAVPELARCTALPRFKDGAEILLDHASLDQIISATKLAAEEIIAGRAI